MLLPVERGDLVRLLEGCRGCDDIREKYDLAVLDKVEDGIGRVGGGVGVDSVVLNFGSVRVALLDGKGEDLRVGDFVRSNWFRVEFVGCDDVRLVQNVKSVELPKLDYGCDDVCLVKVEFWCVDWSMPPLVKGGEGR